MREEPADPFPHLDAETRALPYLVPGAGDDARDEQSAERETDRVRRERQGHARGEQEGSDRRADELVRQQEAALHPGVGDAEVLAGHHPGQERAARRVREGLRRPKDEQRDQHDCDAHRTGDDRGDEDDECQGATEIDHDDHEAPVEAVSGGPTKDAEEQHGEVFAQDRQRDEERVARLGRHQERAGREDDAIADVVDDRGRQEPPEAPTESRRSDGLRGSARE